MARQIEPCPRCGSTWINKGPKPTGADSLDCGCMTMFSFAVVAVLIGGVLTWLLGDFGTGLAVVVIVAMGVLLFVGSILQDLQYNLECAVCGLQWSVYPWQLPKVPRA